MRKVKADETFWLRFIKKRSTPKDNLRIKKDKFSM